MFYSKKKHKIFSVCRAVVGSELWSQIIKSIKSQKSLNSPQTLKNIIKKMGEERVPKFLPELARLEWAISNVTNNVSDIQKEVTEICINPTIQLLELSWKNLPTFFNKKQSNSYKEPAPKKELVIVWKDPKTGEARFRSALHDDLLALKIIDENIVPEKVAEENKVPVSIIDSTIDRAILDGILLSPQSKIRRDPLIFLPSEYIDKSFLSSYSFTLQWHITQACDLHCKHCYDRSTRSHMNIDQALQILFDFRNFCRSRYVKGAITFTGGNPLLYPHFKELYRRASESGFSLAILGNPAPREQIEELLSIQKPTHFQLSLEGLSDYNDYIRGRSHFKRVIDFLKVLREFKIFTMVMLTVTKDNMNQIIQLADMLRDHVDRFHFNRLSMVGEGMNLKLPEKEEYIAFLESYLNATKKNPVLGLKDNMMSILLFKKGLKPFGGCTTYGCGAAFNFLAVLSDGEVHACRKFPSRLGNIYIKSFTEIYDSELAQRYRSGCDACRSCSIRPVCGGCLAVAYSHELNIFKEKDPFCFINTC